MASDPVWQAVGDERLISGFDGSDITVVAGRRWVERQFGAMDDDVEDVLEGPEALLAANIGRLSRTPEDKLSPARAASRDTRSVNRDRAARRVEN